MSASAAACSSHRILLPPPSRVLQPAVVVKLVQPAARAPPQRFLQTACPTVCCAAGVEVTGHPSQTPQLANDAVPAASPPQPIDEKEALRRQRIGAANAGKKSWNEGRKHSPETIEKIRQATRAAMSRPDVRAAYQAGVTRFRAEATRINPAPQATSDETRAKISAAMVVAHARKHAIKLAEAAAQGLDPPAPPRKRVRKAKATPGEADRSAACTQPSPDGGAGGESSGSTAVTAGSKRRSKAASTQTGADGEATPAQPKKRSPPSAEHRAAIAAAIRAKWQDPEYRARALTGIHSHVESKFGSADARPRRSRSKYITQASSSSASSNRAGAAQPSAGSGKAGDRMSLADVQVRLKVVQALVDRITTMRRLVVRMELNLDATRSKLEAFANDAKMATRSQLVLTEAEQALALARTKLDQLQAQAPPGIRYTDQGTMTVTSMPTLLAHLAAVEAAAAAAAAQPGQAALTVTGRTSSDDAPAAAMFGAGVRLLPAAVGADAARGAPASNISHDEQGSMPADAERHQMRPQAASTAASGMQQSSASQNTAGSRGLPYSQAYGSSAQVPVNGINGVHVYADSYQANHSTHATGGVAPANGAAHAANPDSHAAGMFVNGSQANGAMSRLQLSGPAASHSYSNGASAYSNGTPGSYSNGAPAYSNGTPASYSNGAPAYSNGTPASYSNGTPAHSNGNANGAANQWAQAPGAGPGTVQLQDEVSAAKLLGRGSSPGTPSPPRLLTPPHGGTNGVAGPGADDWQPLNGDHGRPLANGAPGQGRPPAMNGHASQHSFPGEDGPAAQAGLPQQGYGDRATGDPPRLVNGAHGGPGPSALPPPGSHHHLNGGPSLRAALSRPSDPSPSRPLGGPDVWVVPPAAAHTYLAQPELGAATPASPGGVHGSASSQGPALHGRAPPIPDSGAGSMAGGLPRTEQQGPTPQGSRLATPVASIPPQQAGQQAVRVEGPGPHAGGSARSVPASPALLESAQPAAEGLGQPRRVGLQLPAQLSVLSPRQPHGLAAGVASEAPAADLQFVPSTRGRAARASSRARAHSS